jgi:hypothetical protein
MDFRGVRVQDIVVEVGIRPISVREGWRRG